MDSLFFPLRSNAGWFEGHATREVLTKRIKRALVTHDRTVFEDGRYRLIASERGRLEFRLGPDAVPGDRSEVRYFVPGKDFSLSMKDRASGEYIPIMEGEALAAYEVDFFPILHEARILDRDYVECRYFEPTEALQRQLKASAQKDARDEAVGGRLAGSHFEVAQLIEGMYFDSALGRYLRAPLMCDPRVVPFVQAKNRQMMQDLWRADLRPFVLESLVNLVLPDFGELDWEDVDRIRESPAGRDLRRYLHRTASEVAREVTDFTDPRDAELVVQKFHLRELAKDLQRRMPDRTKVTVGVFLNFLPLGGWIASAEEITALTESNRSWVSLIEPGDEAL